MAQELVPESVGLREPALLAHEAEEGIHIVQTVGAYLAHGDANAGPERRVVALVEEELAVEAQKGVLVHGRFFFWICFPCNNADI